MVKVTNHICAEIFPPLLSVVTIRHMIVFYVKNHNHFFYKQHILYLLLPTRKLPLDSLTTPSTLTYTCIFCGNVPAIKLYGGDRVTNIRAELSPGEMSGIPSGGFNVDLLPHVRSQYYIDCSGCCIKYEDISSMDVNSVLFDFKWDEQVGEDVLYYHETTDVIALVRNYRTGIARKKRDIRSYLREPISKNKILIPISYNTRTYLSCQKEKDSDGRMHYKAYNLGRP